MTEYIAEKEGMRFYIQPEMMEPYKNAGYRIYKMEPVEVTDIQTELENAEPTTFSASLKGVAESG